MSVMETEKNTCKKNILLAGYTNPLLGKPAFFELWLRGFVGEVISPVDSKRDQKRGHNLPFQLVRAYSGTNVEEILKLGRYNLLIANNKLDEVWEYGIESKFFTNSNGGLKLVKSLRENKDWKTPANIPVVLMTENTFNKEEAIMRYSAKMIESINFLFPQVSKESFLQIIQDCLAR